MGSEFANPKVKTSEEIEETCQEAKSAPEKNQEENQLLKLREAKGTWLGLCPQRDSQDVAIFAHSTDLWAAPILAS